MLTTPSESLSLPPEDEFSAFLAAVVGAAVFDLSGLPRDYFTTSDFCDVSWVQSIFQAIGLQSLLAASLQLEGFRYAVIRNEKNPALVVRQRLCYVALLLQNSWSETIPEDFIHWSLELDPNLLKNSSRFDNV